MENTQQVCQFASNSVNIIGDDACHDELHDHGWAHNTHEQAPHEERQPFTVSLAMHHASSVVRSSDHHDQFHMSGRATRISMPHTPTLSVVPHSADDPHYPPRPERRVHTHHRPSGDVVDPYAWLVNADDPDVLAHLRAENEYATACLAPLTQRRHDIVAAIRNRTEENDVSVATRSGGWFYAAHTRADAAYPSIRRARDADAARDPQRSELVLDQNAEADGSSHSDLGAVEPSPNHHLLAWAHDTDGDEHFTLRIRDLSSGVDLPDAINDIAWSGVAWFGDNENIAYVVMDDTERPYQVRVHALGTPTTTDRVVYTEHDPRFHVSVSSTRRGRWIVIHSASKNSTEAHLLDVTDPRSAPVCVRERTPGVDYSVDDWGDRLLIVHNDQAPDFEVATCEGPGTHWSTLVPHREGRRIVGVEPFAEFCAVLSWSQAQPTVEFMNRDGAVTGQVTVTNEPHDIECGANDEWDASHLRVVVQTLRHPATTYDVDHTNCAAVEVHRTPVNAVHPDDYVTRRIWATAHDGTPLPIDLLHHADTPLDGTAPALCYGYGAYEVSLAPWFSVARTVLVDHGIVWALLHPRGGGEFGRAWYEHGRLEHKHNTFDDVRACVQHLGNGYVDPTRIGLRGGSAGGALVGACITSNPSQFRLGIAEVPFVDVLTTMSDPTLPLTATEWEEWGDPRDPTTAEWIRAWSPYDNTMPADYPAMYVTAGLHDPRVGFHEPAKWVARLRDVTTGTAPIVLRTQLDGGHAGATDRYAAWAEEAEILAFALHHLGVNTDSTTALRHDDS